MKEKPEEIFRKHGSQLRMSKALKHGITRYMLYSLRNKGIIERVTRGIYRLVELPPISNTDQFTVSLRFPNAVICLASALARHDISIPMEPSLQRTGTKGCLTKPCWKSYPGRTSHDKRSG